MNDCFYINLRALSGIAIDPDKWIVINQTADGLQRQGIYKQ